jgi:dienelactone hydrolase
MDTRVATATEHWGNRFTSNGTDYADVEATLRRIIRWEDWCREWGRTASGYEELAEAAEKDGRTITAAGAWRRAALCWHWGKFVFTDYPDQQRAAHDRVVDCFRRGAAGLGAMPVRVPYQGIELAAYLRLPRGPRRPPVVIMLPGLDSVKEELQATAEYFLARGLAVLAVDGPGQGETEYLLPIEPAYEKVATAIVDHLRSRDDVGERIGLYGVSLGGYYAARSAAYEPRLTAAVALAGPYLLSEDWDTKPPQTKRTFQVRSGGADPGLLTLVEAAPLITRPLLVVHGGRDTLVPPWHAERLTEAAPGAELLMYPDGNHGVTNHAYESRSRMADWLAGRLS